MKNQLEEKEKDLLHNKKKEIIGKIVMILRDSDKELYYAPTIEIAEMIFQHINSDQLSTKDREIVADLSRDDIQILMSLNS
jgi:hypothetical protein